MVGRLFDFKSDKHFLASSDRTNLKVYELTNPTTHPSSIIRKTHWREIANISSRKNGSDSDDDDDDNDVSQVGHYDGLLFFDGYEKMEERESLTKLAQHLTRLHLMVSPGGYCFQDTTELGEYNNFGIHYLRLNDLFDWSRHGVDLATTTVWPRSKLKYNVPKQDQKPSKPTTVEGVIMSKEKFEELKRLVKEKDGKLEKLREEMEEELQKLREEKDEELQNLREEMEKASEAKDEELRKVRKEKNEELRTLRKGKNEGASLQKMRKEKDDELRKLRSEMEEEMEKLRREKAEEVEEFEKAKEAETMERLDDQLRKLRKEKHEELGKLLKKKESEVQIMKKGQNEELKKLRDEMDEEKERLRREKDEEVEKIAKEKEGEILLKSKEKDEEKRKFQNEKEELRKLLKKKDDELKILEKEKDEQAILEEVDTSQQSSDKDDELRNLRKEGDEMEQKLKKKEKQLEDMEKMKDDELQALRGKLSSSLADIARIKEQLEQCREKSWSDSDPKTKLLLKLELSEEQQWQIHLRQRRPVPPQTFRREGIDMYSGYRYFDVPKIKDGQTNFFCETSLLVNEEMTGRSLLPPLVRVETRAVGQFDVNNWWFTKALHREGGVTMLAYYDGDRDRVRVSMPKIERPVRLPYSKYDDVYSDWRFFLTRVGNEIRLAFAYRK